MLEAHVGAAGDEGGQVLRHVRRAGSGAIEHDGVVEHVTLIFLIALQALKEMHKLLGEKLVVLRELQLAVLVLRVRQAVMGTLDAELDGEGVADAHAVLAVEHEGDAAGDVRIKRQRDEVEHGAVILAGIALGMRVELKVRVILFLQRDIDPLLGRDEAFLHFVERCEVLVHLFTVGFAEALVERLCLFEHGVDQLDAALEIFALGLHRRAVGAEESVENLARIILGRDRLTGSAVGNGAGAREETHAGIDGHHQRRLPAKLLRVLSHHLVECHAVVHLAFGVLQRCAGEPHVRTHVRIGLRAVRVIEPTHKTQLLAERRERLGRFTKNKLAILLRAREPAPLIDAVLGVRQRHSVGRVQRAETPRRLFRHVLAHRLQHRQRQRHARRSLKERAPVEFESLAHVA